ncbi:hypothetical protein CAEBREN_04451 [Caenorhabditis brenneri]|uniref:Uncharacterized protein n=1 Tax=Caenorhabditis brenneri TaxID=135651 RepID=G0MQ80_CAEBE|nr:hypothetical protein CAEBREN_04451 [Caenorhabditis brenneri]
MSSVPEKEKEKDPDEKPKKEKKRKLWLYRRKVISVDDTYLTFEDEGQIDQWYINYRVLRSPDYRKWLVDSGYWIPSMDLKELFFTIDPEEYTVEEDEEAGGVASEQAESLEERMKKLKAQQQGNFKKYYERKEAIEKIRKSKNSKSKVKKIRWK